MSREDYEIFNDIRREKQERRAKSLAKADDFGWSKHSDTHWYRMIDGEKLHYWPSANKWLYKGCYYRGGLPRELGKKIDEDNARLRKEN